MELYFSKAPEGNFGDDLNIWLWPKAWPDYRTYSQAEWLVGIGSILDGRLNSLAGRALILGAGYRPSRLGKARLERCTITFVRGPLTCAALGLPDRIAVADPGILTSHYAFRNPTDGDTVSFMPHVSTAGFFTCLSWADRSGLELIDPRWPVSRVLNALSRTDRLLTEAMHGAIVADAMGVPWKRVTLFNTRYEPTCSVDFKWHDWAAALGLSAEPSFQVRLPWPGRSKLRRALKQAYLWRYERDVCRLLQKEKDSSGFRLSSRSRLTGLAAQIVELIGSLDQCDHAK